MLEVAAGTGANLGHYKPKQVESLTLLDNSAAMLRQAAHKARDMRLAFPGAHPSDAFDLRYNPTVVSFTRDMTDVCSGLRSHKAASCMLCMMGSASPAAARAAAVMRRSCH